MLFFYDRYVTSDEAWEVANAKKMVGTVVRPNTYGGYDLLYLFVSVASVFDFSELCNRHAWRNESPEQFSRRFGSSG